MKFGKRIRDRARIKLEIDLTIRGGGSGGPVNLEKIEKNEVFLTYERVIGS